MGFWGFGAIRKLNKYNQSFAVEPAPLRRNYLDACMKVNEKKTHGKCKEVEQSGCDIALEVLQSGGQ